MHVHNKLLPSEVQLIEMAKPGPEGPICMVNLLKYKECAEYEDGRETSLSGAEAYAIYGAAVLELMGDYGAYLGFSGAVSNIMLGDVEEPWDSIALAYYPSRAKMLEMFMSPVFQEISVHRTAGLAGQLNIETAGLMGSWFNQN
ncbi:MAG: DUF1330 domain-containing protein [Pseudomonadota bacterium]